MMMNTISIASSAMLVDLTLKGYTGKKQDRHVAEEVSLDKGAQARAGTYQKNLFAGCKELASIQGYDVLIRQWHASRTLPWSDRGPRLLPTANYFTYLQELQTHNQAREVLVTEFEQAYTQIIQAAQFELGALFNIDDYPDVSEIRHKFTFTYNIFPLPESGDFRIDIGNEGLELLKHEFEEAQQSRITEAMQDIRNRVKEVVEKLSNQLRTEPDGKKGRVHESTLDACLELCDAMGALNLTGDPEIEQMKRDLRNTVQYVDVKEIRKDTGAREQVKKELDHLLEKFDLI
jgi:hypothetical protein